MKCRIWDPTSDLQNRHLARQGSPGVMGCPVFNSAMLCVTEGTGAGGCGGRRPLSQQDSEMKTQLPHLMFLIKEEIESCWDPSNSESSATAARLTPGKGQAQMELSRRRPHGIHLGRRELYPWSWEAARALEGFASDDGMKLLGCLSPCPTFKPTPQDPSCERAWSAVSEWGCVEQPGGGNEGPASSQMQAKGWRACPSLRGPWAPGKPAAQLGEIRRCSVLRIL